MVKPPATRYARSGQARIAYQVSGRGSVDLVLIGGPAAHLDLLWEEPATARTFQRYGSFSRLIQFDRRGTGLSDPADTAPTLEQQMDDLSAVLDAIGVERAAIQGGVDAGLAAMYAATYPDRVTALVLYGVAPAGGTVLTPERREVLLDIVENHWGEGALLPLFAPSKVGDRRFEDWWIRFERACASPAMARMLIEFNLRTDLRGVLSTIRVPTLVLHRTGDALIPVEAGRETAALIPGARFVELPGIDAYGWLEYDGPWIDIVEEFLTGRRPAREPERVLSTVLFTDIVGSTERAAAVGDRAWRDLLDRHNALVREELDRWRGREIKTVGDGFLATFDGPARAVRCAEAVATGVRDLSLHVRAGVHTGECEISDGDVTGIAVHIAARVLALANAGDVLVSSTVKDLVVGSGLDFADRGTHELRGVPGEWRLYALRRGAGGGH
jgi:class 3 adenylate cyclase/pimeloyl-ACP methyl ester carboxylesterase